MNNGFYTIGELSEICGINKSTLRFYDDKKLLIPSFRDKINNYRYYTEEDVMNAIIIKELQKKGMNIGEMKNILNERSLNSLKNKLENTISSLEKEKNILEEKISYAKNKYHSIEQCLNISNKIKEEGQRITIRKTEDTYAIFTKYKSKVKATKLFWGRHVELTKLSEELDLTISGPFTAIFHDYYKNQFFIEEGELEVLYPILKPSKLSENIKYIEGGKFISTIYIGKYQNLLPSYSNLIEYADKNNIEITGKSIEEYLCDFTLGLNEEDYITRISFPIKNC